MPFFPPVTFNGETYDLSHLDPMTLKIAALLAVISRMKKEQEVDIVSRARMYDGEQLVVEMKNPPATSQSTDGFGRALSTGSGPYGTS